MGKPILSYAQARQKYNTTNAMGPVPNTSPQTPKAAFRQSLYDFQTYANAGTTPLYSYFQTPVGQSSKTLQDTNMVLAGTLSAGTEFLVERIEIHMYPGVLNQPAEDVTSPFAAPQFINDVAALNKAGYLTVQILNQTWLTEAPLGRMPPATRLTGNAAMAATDAVTTVQSFNQASFATFGGEVYDVEGLWLPSNTNFSVNLNFPTTTALPSGVDAKVGIVLKGTMYRNIQ